jgi:hypothetical protein
MFRKRVEERAFEDLPRSLPAEEILENKMVPPVRFERTTHGLGIRCSILLSYGGRYI